MSSNTGSDTVVKHGGLVLPDADSSFSSVILPNKDQLTEDLKYKLPNEAGTIAGLKDIEALKQELTGGGDGAAVADSKKLNGKAASFYANADLSNVDAGSLPDAVVAALQGPRGIQGVKGDQGNQGVKGDQGTIIHFVTGTPDILLGGINDVAIDMSTWDIFKKETANTWAPKGNIRGGQGIQGIQGIDGSEIIIVSGTPSPSVGRPKDCALDLATGNFYKKSAGNTWASSGSLKGPTGATGRIAKTISVSTPSGGVDGDVWFQYEA